MKKNNNTRENEFIPFRPFAGKEVDDLYVAFVDILGFGRQVLQNFDDTLKIYEDVLNSSAILKDFRQDVNIRIYSDAFMVTSKKLGSLIGVVQGLHMQTLFHDCLVRGGIGYGKHIEIHIEQDSYIVSQGLVQAVEVEKRINYPCVALHDSIKVPQEWWNPEIHPVYRGLSYFEGIRLVTPFNIVWGQSAMTRVVQLTEQYPEYQDKYDWFLRLYEATFSGNPLVPESKQ
jgi:hypothetical protein